MTKQFDYHTKNCKMVGVMVPQPIVEYLTLYALSRKRTKSNIVRTWINSSYTELHNQQPKAEIIKIIVSQFQSEWTYLKNTGTDIEEFSNWKKELEKKLIYSRLSVTLINQILKKLKV
jgi:hypothetical protein